MAAMNGAEKVLYAYAVLSAATKLSEDHRAALDALEPLVSAVRVCPLDL